MPGKVAKVYIKDEILDNVKISNQKNALEVQGEIKPQIASELEDHERPEIGIDDIHVEFLIGDGILFLFCQVSQGDDDIEAR